ncbi:MAG: BTAD domain-containing putative transcriptional regulator [Lachnospiraceae bacterium]|nr:BTAD domain-containing putative transcriptional regulator [Lachnospiraceae bacterium]
MDDTLKIQMFGEFSISNKYYSMVSTTSNSMQVQMLLSYLIANKDTKVSKQKLMEILWPGDTCNKPAGALRNLVYRARKEMANFFPDGNEECIMLVQNAYVWNPQIPCEIDIYEFEMYYNLAQREENPAKRYEYSQKVLNLYKGAFLPLQSGEEWVMYRSVYYHRLFTKCALSMINYLEIYSSYDEILQLCDRAIELEPSDEPFHREKLCALLKMGRIQPAIEYYHNITELFSQKYGIDITDSLQDIYKQLVHALPNSNLSMDTLEETLRVDTPQKGSFYCNFDIFKNIYQINLRSARRSQSRRYLVLLTLFDTKNDGIFTTDIREEMDTLYAVLSKNLRSNDVFTQSSISQLSLILTVPNERGCHVALNRITEKYENKKTHLNIELHVDVKQII